MNSFSRLIPFVWPHRRKVIVSLTLALVVAMFWAINLSFTFLIVKVLLEGQSLEIYVEQQIALTETEVSTRTLKLKNLEYQIRRDDSSGRTPSASQKSKNHDARSKEQWNLSSASQKLMVLYWVQSKVLPYVPRDQFDTFAMILGLLLATTLVKGLCILAQDMLAGSVVELVVMGIRKACYRHTLALDYQTLLQNGTSDLMARFTNDVTVMSNGLLLLGGKVVREPLKAAACIAFALFVNWRLTLLGVFFVPVIGYVFYRFGKSLKQASRRTMESMSQIYKSLEETFEGFKIVAVFGGGRRHRQQFHRHNKKYYAQAMKVVRVEAMTSPTTELMGSLAVIIVLLPGAYLVLRNTTEIWNFRLSSKIMDVAQLSLLYALLAGTLDPIRKLASVYVKLKRASAGIDRIFQLMELTPLVRDPQQPKVLPRHSRSIAFDNVVFSYINNDNDGQRRPAALQDVTLNVEAGEVIAIVGENGSGKSTLVNLLPRLYDCDRGAVWIDGVNIRDVRLRDLRSQIGYVTQETILFDDTIYENIRYGKPNSTRKEIEAAAQQARVTQFFDQLPDGFDTRVGTRGQFLSGGQRQRIALARAILRDPSILILDEATSAIDAQSESLIHQALSDFAPNRTVFIITHSMSPGFLDLITRIAVMKSGKLVATGSHDELIKHCLLYQRLYHTRVADESEPAEEAQARDVFTAAPGGHSAAIKTADENPDVIPFPKPRATTNSAAAQPHASQPTTKHQDNRNVQ